METQELIAIDAQTVNGRSSSTSTTWGQEEADSLVAGFIEVTTLVAPSLQDVAHGKRLRDACLARGIQSAVVHDGGETTLVTVQSEFDRLVAKFLGFCDEWRTLSIPQEEVRELFDLPK